MTHLLLAISGCGGGNQGPQGIFQLFQQHCDENSIKVIAPETLSNEEEENVVRISEAVKELLQSYEDIYLVGYSMGGAVAVQVAWKLNQIAKNRVKGLVLLATQTDGLHFLKELSIPVLFYHGEEDSIFPVWQIESIFKNCTRPKRMVKIEGLGHNLTPEGNHSSSSRYSSDLARHVFTEISDFFFSSGEKEKTAKEEIISKKI